MTQHINNLKMSKLCIFSRPESLDNYERTMSQEDTVWQNEVKEVIWLELQAWLAGNNVTCQDQWIHKKRESLKECAKQVCEYRFTAGDLSTRRPGYDQQMSEDSIQDSSAALDIYYDAQESVETQPSETDISAQLDNLDIDRQDTLTDVRQDTLTRDNVDDIDDIDGAYLSSVSQDHGADDDVCDSLNIKCDNRIANTEKALAEVEEMLNSIDSCEQLFPSSRVLISNNDAWTDEEFQARVKVLCVWFNLTDQLHRKTEQIGRALRLGAKLGPHHDDEWPVLKTVKQNTTTDKPAESSEQAEESKASEASKVSAGDVPDCKKSPVKIVKFQVSEDHASTTSPSDSNNSTDSSSHANLLMSTKRFVLLTHSYMLC